jgi:hypothetical protein
MPVVTSNTGPDTGSASRGVVIVAVPTREPSGQVSEVNCETLHRAVAPLVLNPRPAGSVTIALDCADSPVAWEIVALNGTCDVRPVAPTPPIVAVTFGLNASLSQSVGVKELVAEAFEPS